MDEPLSLESNPDKPIDKDYKKKRVDEIGSALAQIRARVKANRTCSKKEDENAASGQKLPREMLSEKSELYMQVLEQDKVKAQKLEKERPKIKEAIENLKIDRENQKLVEKKIDENRAKLLSAPLPEIPQEVQKRILEMEMTIHILKENLAEKESVLQSKADSWRVVSEELEKRNAETVERAERMRREIDSVREAYAGREELLTEELDITRRELAFAQEELMNREGNSQDSAILQSELSQAQNELNRAKDELKREQNQLAKLQSELSETQNELDTTTARFSSVQNEHSKLSKELDEVRHTHGECENKFAEMKKAWDQEKRLALKLKAQLKNLRNEIASKKTEDLSSEVEKLQNQVASLEEEKGNLQLQLVDFDDTKDNALQLENRISELESLHQTTLEDLAAAKQSYDALLADAERWKEQLHEHESQLEGLMDSVARAEQLQLEAELRAAALEEKLDAAQPEITTVKSSVPDVSVLREQIAGDLILEWTSRYAEVEETASRFSMHLASLAADYDQLKSSYVELEDSFARLSSEKERLIIERDHLIASRDRELNEWTERYAQLEAAFAELSLEKDKLLFGEGIQKSHIKHLQATATSTEEDISIDPDWEKKNIEWQKKYSHLEDEFDKLSSARDNLISERDDLSVIRDKELLEWTTRYGQLEEAFSQLSMERDALINKLEVSRNNEWKERYSEVAERLAVFINEQGTLITERDNLTAELSNLRVERNNIMAERDALISERENSTADEQLKLKAKKLAVVLKTKVAHLKEVEGRLVELEETLSRTKEENLRLESALNESRTTEISVGDRSVQDLTDANRMLEQQVIDLESRLTDTLAEGERMKDRLCDAVDELGKLQDTLMEQQEEALRLAQSEVQQRDTISALRIQLDEVERTLVEQQEDSLRLQRAEEAAAESALRSRLMEIESKLGDKLEEVRILRENDTKLAEDSHQLREAEAVLRKQLVELEEVLKEKDSKQMIEIEEMKLAQERELQEVCSKLKQLEHSVAQEGHRFTRLQEECAEQIKAAEMRALTAGSRAVELEAELNDIKSAYATTLDQIEALNEELKVVMGEVEGRNQQLVRTDKERRELALKLQETEQELANLRAELASQTANQDEGCEWAADARLEEEHQGVTALKNENERLHEEVQTLRLNFAKLARRVKDQKAQLEQQQKDRNSQNMGLGLDELGLAEELRGQLDSIEAERTKLAAELTTMKAERDKLRSRVDVLTSANEQLIDLKERHDIEVQGYRRTISELRNHNTFDWGRESGEPPSAGISASGDVDRALQERATILETENEELQQVVNEANSEKQNLVYELNSLKEEIRILRESSPPTAVPLASNFFGADTSKSFLLQESENNSSTNVSQTKEENDALKKQVEDLSKTLHDLQEEYNHLKNNYESIIHANNHLSGEISQLHGENKDLIQKSKELESLVEHLKEEASVRGSSIQKLQNMESEIEIIQEEASRQSEGLKRELLEAHKEVEALKVAVASLTQENSNFQVQVKTAHEEIESLKKSTVEIQKKVQVSMESQPAPVYNDPTILSSPPIFKGFFSDSDDPFVGVNFPVHEDITKQSVTLMEASKDNVRDVQNQIEKCLEKENADLLKKVEETEIVAREEADLRKQCNRIQELELEVQTYRDQVVSLTRSLEDSSRSSINVQELEKEIEALDEHIKAMNQVVQDTSRERDENAIRVKEVEQELQSLHSHINKINLDLQGMTIERDEKAKRIQELEREVQALHHHINSLNQSMQDSGRDRDDTIGKMLELERESFSLREQVKKMHTENIAMQQQVESLHKQLTVTIEERDKAASQALHALTQELEESRKSSGDVKKVEEEVLSLRRHLAEVQASSAEEAHHRETWFQHALLAKEEEAGQLRNEAERAAAEYRQAMEEAAKAAHQVAAALVERDEAVTARLEAERQAADAFSSRSAELEYLSSGLAERDATIAEKDAALAQKDAELEQKISTLAQKESILMEKEAALALKDSTVVSLGAEKDRLERELHEACDRCNAVEENLHQREALWAAASNSDEIEKLRAALEAKEGELENLGKMFVEAQERLVAAEQNRPGGKELVGLRARLDNALYTVHLRDIRCEELTREIMQLLEERDVLQLQLSQALRANEKLRTGEVDEPSGSTSLNPTMSHKLGEVHSGYMKDPVVQYDRQNRHSQQMNLLNPAVKTEKEEDISGLFQWFFGGSSSSASSEHT